MNCLWGLQRDMRLTLVALVSIKKSEVRRKIHFLNTENLTDLSVEKWPDKSKSFLTKVSTTIENPILKGGYI